MIRDNQPVWCDKPPTAPCHRKSCIMPEACGYVKPEIWEQEHREEGKNQFQGQPEK